MQSYRHILRSAVCAGALSVGALALPAQGSLLALEQFDYTAGTNNLGTFNGGTGWSGGWKNDAALTASSTADIQASSLATPDGYSGATAGGSLIEPAVLVYRALSSQIHLDVDQDYYVSVLSRRSGTNDKSMNFQLMSGTSTVAMFGNSSSGSVFVGGIGATTSGSTPHRIDFGATPEDASTYLWVFKVSAKATEKDQVFVKTYLVGTDSVDKNEPAVWEVTGAAADSSSSSIDRIGIVTAGGQTLELDEIRIGTTWADVAAVPEPASISLIGLAGLALLGRRRAKA